MKVTIAEFRSSLLTMTDKLQIPEKEAKPFTQEVLDKLKQVMES